MLSSTRQKVVEWKTSSQRRAPIEILGDAAVRVTERATSYRYSGSPTEKFSSPRYHTPGRFITTNDNSVDSLGVEGHRWIVPR